MISSLHYLFDVIIVEDQFPSVDNPVWVLIKGLLNPSLAEHDMPSLKKPTDLDVVVVLIFNATRHPRHIEAAAIAMMYMYLYSLAFMDHPCTLGTAVCHQAPPCPLYTQPRARRV